MKTIFKNIYKTSSFSSFSFLIKISFTIFFFAGHDFIVANMDASHPWQIGFQDPATPIMEGIIFFNGLLMTFMIFIACLVGWLLYKSLTLFDESVHENSVGFTHSTLLEVVWTIIPAVILMVISIPSYNLLYAMDEVIDPSLTIKVVGHQWYWSYECSDFETSPKDQIKNLQLINDTQTRLKFWVDILNTVNAEAEAGAKQTQLTLVEELLDFLESDKSKFVLKNLSEETSLELSYRLDYISLLLCLNESFKETYGSIDDLKHGEMAEILSLAKVKLEKGSFIPKHQEGIIKILKNFKQYLRINKNVKVGVTESNLISILKDEEMLLKLRDHLLNFKSCSTCNSKKFDSDDDSNNDDDGSIVTDLIDFDKSNPYWEWCELDGVERQYNNDDANLIRAASEALISERICTNAALLPEENNTPFLELMENMKQDRRQFKKAIPIAELSENKLIDTQLIEHQLRLTRSEREGFSSEYAWNSALVASNFAEVEFKNALVELNNAKLHSHWAKIELAAANVNMLTAVFFQADASLGITDPLFVRSVWINKKGYYSWNDFLRLAIKKLSDVEKLNFLHADEELNGANSLLGKAQRNLTLEEREKSNSIADNAKAEFMAMEKEIIPAIEEFMRGKDIVANAKAELATYQDISDRADVRLKKAQVVFDQAKVISNRTQARLNAAESFYKSAQAKLTGSEVLIEFVPDKDKLDVAQLKFQNLIKNFEKAVLDVDIAKSDLLVAQKRLEQVKVNLKKTEKVFENTGLLEKQIPVEGKPTEYYDNFLWEIHNEDLAFVKAQLKTDKAELEVANTSLEIAEKNLSQIGGDLLEAELNTNKALINYLNNKNKIDAILLDHVKRKVSGIEFIIAEAIYTKALADFELKGSNLSQSILTRATKALDAAKSNFTNDYLGSALDNNLNKIESENLISDYAENCLISAQEELEGAEADYVKARNILVKGENLLEILGQTLSKDYDNPYLDTLRVLFKDTMISLKNRIEQLNLISINSSPLDIKLEPGLLQSKSYKEVLLAKAELANIKWLCARVTKTLDIPLFEEVKPFNVQFSHLKSEDSSIDNISSNNADNNAEGGSDDKKGPKSEDSSIDNMSSNNAEGGSDDKKGPKSEDSSIDNMSSNNAEGGSDGKKGPKSEGENNNKNLSKVVKNKFPYTLLGLTDEMRLTFREVIDSLDNEDKAKELLRILNDLFQAMVVEEIEKNQLIKNQIKFIKNNLVSLETEKSDEKQRINFDSYLIADDDLIIPEAFGTGKAGTVFRLLEVDNRLFVPTNTHIRLLVTSADVLHSWAVPSLGIKVDACPGRLNQVFLFVKREGVFYGQCSELCGVNHGFMPIVVQAVSQDEYLTWVGKRLCS